MSNTPDQISIPSEFVKLSNIEAEKYSSKLYSGTRLIDADNSGISNTSFLAGARWAYRHLMGKPSGLSLLKEGDRVVLDKDFNNASVVDLVKMSKHYSTVRDQEGNKWDTMTNRLSAICPSSPETGSVND